MFVVSKGSRQTVEDKYANPCDAVAGGSVGSYNAFSFNFNGSFNGNGNGNGNFQRVTGRGKFLPSHLLAM
jgi:hypothetical protein